MIGINHVNDFLERIGVSDMTYSVVSKDSFGDLISVFDPDFSYSTLRHAINSNRAMSNKIEDSGLYHCEIWDVVYVDGNPVKIAILCEKGQNGFGTSIKIMVKHVTVFINGSMKSFLSFESLKSYKSRVLR